MFFVVELKRLCSKHEQVSLRKERDIEFWVEPFSKCWDYHVSKLMSMPSNVCFNLITGWDMGPFLLKVYSGIFQIIKGNRLNRTIKTLREEKWYYQSHESGDQIWLFLENWFRLRNLIFLLTRSDRSQWQLSSELH